jgi:ABC-2 type transport system ATP-binding protein
VARVLGYDVAEQPLEVKRRVGVLPEEVDTYERLTGRELLIFTGRIHGLSRDDAVLRSDQLLDLVELDADDRRRMVVDYSMGMRKKTVLACALIHNPRVLFLDEPFNGIDAVTTQALQAVLGRLVERGVTIFFSSHVLDVVERMCTRLGIVHHGRLVACGTLDEIREQTDHGVAKSLQEIFVDLVGGRVERGGLEWLG